MSRNNKYQNNQRGKGTTLAGQADRYVLYEKAVQCVDCLLYTSPSPRD